MSTATAQKATNGTAEKPFEISYVPLGETESIKLTLTLVKKFLCVPTRSGKLPTDEHVMKFMMMCRAQSLNPWLNDAYLVGYDSKDGPTFSLITAHQAFLKRAEASPEFDGIESGVIVMRGDQITERAGDLVIKGETLVGGWARAHRRDRTVPSYDAINLETFDTGRSRWAADKAGMIVKVAEASALRKAFPSTLAAMYCKEEMDRDRILPEETTSGTRSKVDLLASQLIGTLPAAIEHKPVETAFETQTEDERELEPVAKTEPVKGKREASKQAESIHSKLLHRVATAVDVSQLELVMHDAAQAVAAGELTATEHTEINNKCGDKVHSFQ